MYNSPHETESLPRVLPGKLLTLDAQCRKDRGTSACFKDDRVCSQLFCFDAGSGYCVSYRPAAEGSRCGDNQVFFVIFEVMFVVIIFFHIYLIKLLFMLHKDVLEWKMHLRA